MGLCSSSQNRKWKVIKIIGILKLLAQPPHLQMGKSKVKWVTWPKWSGLGSGEECGDQNSGWTSSLVLSLLGSIMEVTIQVGSPKELSRGRDRNPSSTYTAQHNIHSNEVIPETRRLAGSSEECSIHNNQKRLLVIEGLYLRTCKMTLPFTLLSQLLGICWRMEVNKELIFDANLKNKQIPGCKGAHRAWVWISALPSALSRSLTSLCLFPH